MPVFEIKEKMNGKVKVEIMLYGNPKCPMYRSWVASINLKDEKLNFINWLEKPGKSYAIYLLAPGLYIFSTDNSSWKNPEHTWSLVEVNDDVKEIAAITVFRGGRELSAEDDVKADLEELIAAGEKPITALIKVAKKIAGADSIPEELINALKDLCEKYGKATVVQALNHI